MHSNNYYYKRNRKTNSLNSIDVDVSVINVPYKVRLYNNARKKSAEQMTYDHIVVLRINIVSPPSLTRQIIHYAEVVRGNVSFIKSSETVRLL